MTNFDDHFSRQAHEYARSRPSYPAELFAYLADQASRRELAWDCGTGSGQAALELVKHFDRVVATDASAEQIAQAPRHDRIQYRVEQAEDVALAARSVDLITVGIAIHWFDFERFYAAVRRVASKDGLIAAWTYHLPAIEPDIDQILVRYYTEILAGYWPERFEYVESRYRTLPFPFDELEPPEFKMGLEWTLAHVVGFLESWSASGRYREEHGRSPVEPILAELTEAWGNPDKSRKLDWPLYVRVGRVV